MSVLNAKLENLLIYWFFVNSPNHEIRLMFKEYDLANSAEFFGYDKQFMLDMKRKKNLVITPLNSQKIKIINAVLLYYECMS